MLVLMAPSLMPTSPQSTLQVTASRMIMRDATAVMCLITTANETDNFTVAGDFCCNLFKYARESVYNCVYMGSYMAVSVSTLNYLCL